MPSRLSATARREQLLDVALEVFARSGYHETSMNDVVNRDVSRLNEILRRNNATPVTVPAAKGGPR